MLATPAGGDEPNHLAKFDAVFPIEDIARLENELSVRTSRTVSIPRMQTGGPKTSFASLSSAAKTVVLEYTKDDYEFLKKYYSPPA